MTTTRKVLVERGGDHTVHELDCNWIAGRVNKRGLVVEDYYDEVPANRVPANAHRCSWCAPGFDPTRQPDVPRMTSGGTVSR
jgi:hypothetical protein